jgi:hypothetical protein
MIIDRLLTPEDGGSSNAGKAVVRQLAAASRVQFDRMKQAKENKAGADDSGGEINPSGDICPVDADYAQLKRGHRIRAQVSSGAFPRFARNLGTGEPLATGTARRYDDAHPHQAQQLVLRRLL